MDNKSLEMLEFPHIREILASYTSFSASRELAMALEPGTDYNRIELLLRQTTEARRLLELDRSFAVGTISDIRDKVRLAALEGILDPAGLLEVQQALSSLHTLRRYLKGLSDDFPLLWNIVQGIAELHQIEKNIADCLDPGGEVLDTASPVLANIRHQLRDTRSQILERLEDIIRSPKGNRILQEDIITEREGRYVVLVKTDSRHEIKGIVHDISNTGATVFMEPTATVGLGNALRELVIEERREVERILRILSAEVGAQSEDIVRSIELCAELDFILAKARYGYSINAVEPIVVSPVGSEPTILGLVNARHPLLGEKAVAFSTELGREYSVMVITGPNTGGKTVTLKTIGLLSLMVQSGMPIPAASESRLPVFDSVFADIGDEQSIEQTLSTFSWHMGNIVRIIKRATSNSLVLLDELGTSTDPAEGSALARAILRRFLDRKTLTVATTHYGDLKSFAYATPGMENASLEFDPVTLSPTYHLIVGLPGGSNAMATAARLGLPPEIIEEARNLMAEGSQELETLLTSLMEEKQKLSILENDLKAEKDDFSRRNIKLQKDFDRLKNEQHRAIQQARDSIVREAAELHLQIRQASAELRKEKSTAVIEEAKRDLTRVRKQLAKPEWQPIPVTENSDDDTEAIRVGDIVRLKEAGMTANVISIFDESREVELQSGRTKMRLSLDSVTKMKTVPEISLPSPGIQPSTRHTPLQVDLRGKRADEIEPILDVYLNDAVQSNLSQVRIIHGIATGTVRNIVRELLAGHTLVKSFRPGERDEGGDGATIVRL